MRLINILVIVGDNTNNGEILGKWSNMTDGDLLITKGTFDNKIIFDINGNGYSIWIFGGTSLVNNKPENRIVFCVVR